MRNDFFPTAWGLAGLALLAGTAACDGPSGTTLPSDTDTDTEPPATLPQVYINELVADNATGLQDESGKYPDWFELYNPNDEPVDLAGWWLADSPLEANKFNWQIPPGIVIPGKGYVVFFADNDVNEGDLHAGFVLDNMGESVVLYGPNVNDNPLIDGVDFDPQFQDRSLARMPDGGATWEFDETPTPGAPNG